MGLKRQQIGNTFVLPVSGRKMRRMHCKTYEKAFTFSLYRGKV